MTSPLGPAVRLPKGVTADLGDLGDVESDEPFSCGAWVQVTDTVDGALLARMDIANGNRGWDLYMKGSRAAVQIISSWNQDALRVVAGPAVKSEGWHHVFVTYDGSRKAKGVKIYYDGEAQDVYEEVDSLRGSIRTKTPLRLNRRSTGEGAERCRRLRHPLLPEGVAGPGGAGARPAAARSKRCSPRSRASGPRNS